MLEIDPSVPVVVLGAHHGALGIARSLGRLGIPVHCVHDDPRAPALASRYVTSAMRCALEPSPSARAVARLAELAERLGQRPVLIATTDTTSLFVAEHADVLAHHFRFARQSAELVRSFNDKRCVFELAQRLGIPTPSAVFPHSGDSVREFAARATFPVMLKGIDGTRLAMRSGRKMLIIRSERELLVEYTRLEDPAAPNLMLQEYIPGGDDTVWIFNGYFDTESRCLAGFTGKKLRQYPVHVGATSLGVCLPNESVARLTMAFMEAVGYRGVLDIGYRYDARDGQYKLLDPNPRVGSTFRLFVAENGLDVVRCAYLDLTGQPVPAATPQWGRRWIVEDMDVESCLAYRREGALTLSAWIASLQAVEEWAWFASDDMTPFVLLSCVLVWRLLRWASRRGWVGLRKVAWDALRRWWSEAVPLVRDGVAGE